jgi:hypothetical protein
MNVDAAVDIDVAVVGNLVSFFMDVQAVGADGATQTSVAVVTTEDYASFVAGGYSAVA